MRSEPSLAKWRLFKKVLATSPLTSGLRWIFLRAHNIQDMKSPVRMVSATEALSGRESAISVTRPHLTLGSSLMEPFPVGTEIAYFGLGCFWGAERKFYELPGVVSTAVGYQGGFTPHPTYHEVCTGLTGHTESVRVVFDPQRVGFVNLLACFFENHDPTQGFRQGNDIGTQYRSAIYTTTDAQMHAAVRAAGTYQQQLHAAGFGDITTEITVAGTFYLAEEYHQQYLEANPNGYCGIGGTGVSCPIGLFS